MDDWLQVLREPLRVVGVITGDSGQGKTTMVQEVVEALRRDGIRVGGIITPGEMKDDVRWSFDLVDLGTDRRLPMGTRDDSAPWPRVGGFRVNPEALAVGEEALSADRAGEFDLLVVDEIGPWELVGEGWSSALEGLYGTGVWLLPVVRRHLVKDVVARLAPGGAPVWDVAELDAETVAGEVRRRLRDG
jgi:nucleoside-triphosphatase THEP1